MQIKKSGEANAPRKPPTQTVNHLRCNVATGAWARRTIGTAIPARFHASTPELASAGRYSDRTRRLRPTSPARAAYGDAGASNVPALECSVRPRGHRAASAQSGPAHRFLLFR